MSRSSGGRRLDASIFAVFFFGQLDRRRREQLRVVGRRRVGDELLGGLVGRGTSIVPWNAGSVSRASGVPSV